MDIWQSFLLAITQGLTEFLPVSSSGHLFLLNNFFTISQDLNLIIWLHLSSLLAILVFFYKNILEMSKDFFREFFHPKKENATLTWKIIIATIFTIPMAIFLSKFFTDLNTQIVSITLILTGFLIFLAEKFRPKKELNLTFLTAIFLGIVQGISVIPGLSRSGLTIAFLILLGINRQKSAKISFLLAIPTILGAFVFSLSDFSVSFFNLQILLAMLICFVVSLLAIKFMLKLVEKNWIWFAPYCIILGTWILL